MTLNESFKAKYLPGTIVTRQQFMADFADSEWAESNRSSFMANSEINSDYSPTYDKFLARISEGVYVVVRV